MRPHTASSKSILFLVLSFSVLGTSCGLGKSNALVKQLSEPATTLSIAYEQSVHPYLVQHCSSCHGHAATPLGAFASRDPVESWQRIQPIFQVERPSALHSRMSDRHCGTLSCFRSISEVDSVFEVFRALFQGPPTQPSPSPSPTASPLGPRLAALGALTLSPPLLLFESRRVLIPINLENGASPIQLWLDAQIQLMPGREIILQDLTLQTTAGQVSAQGFWFRINDTEWSTQESLVFAFSSAFAYSPSPVIFEPLSWLLPGTEEIARISNLEVGLAIWDPW
jgi:hypothetical protein